MKKGITFLALLMILGTVSTAALAEPLSVKGEITGLAGNKNTGWINYKLNEKCQLTGLYDESDNEKTLKGGIYYRINDRFGFKAGAFYNIDDASEAVPYGGIDWSLPLGNGTRVMGSYDYDYKGKEWQTYEAYLRIEMFPHQYVHAGVRGDTGDGAVGYDYDGNKKADNKEALLFLRGDFNWQWKKYGLNLRPLLYIKGDYFHDYDFTYQLGKKANLIFNFNTLYDKDEKYRLGIQYRF